MPADSVKEHLSSVICGHRLWQVHYYHYYRSLDRCAWSLHESSFAVAFYMDGHGKIGPKEIDYKELKVAMRTLGFEPK